MRLICGGDPPSAVRTFDHNETVEGHIKCLTYGILYFILQLQPRAITGIGGAAIAAEHSTIVTQPLQFLGALSRYRGSKLPQWVALISMCWMWGHRTAPMKGADDEKLLFGPNPPMLALHRHIYPIIQDGKEVNGLTGGPALKHNVCLPDLFHFQDHQCLTAIDIHQYLIWSNQMWGGTINNKTPVINHVWTRPDFDSGGWQWCQDRVCEWCSSWFNILMHRWCRCYTVMGQSASFSERSLKRSTHQGNIHQRVMTTSNMRVTLQRSISLNK